MWRSGRFRGWAAALAVVLTVAGAFAQDPPKIAVYVTGDTTFINEKKSLSTKMQYKLVNSGRYTVIERTSAFIEAIDKEHIKQRSGAIDDSQISKLGKQFGARFVCVGDITTSVGAFHVSARIIDVETAEVVAMGEDFTQLRNPDDLEMVSDKVAKQLLRLETEPAQLTPKVPKSVKIRKHDYYFAARYALPLGISSPWGAVNVEGGWVWGNGTFFGIDFNFGYWDSYTIGGTLSLGGVYDLPYSQMQLVYGGSVGPLIHSDWKHYYDDRYGYYRDRYEGRENENIFGPFIKLRWKSFELSYRGLLGMYYRYYDYNHNNNGYYDYEDYESGFGWTNHQIMLGVYFATSKRVRK